MEFEISRQGRTNPTVHAFAHGLSSVLTFIRNRLSCGPLSHATKFSTVPCLATVWFYYAELEQVVIALASMCSRVRDKSLQFALFSLSLKDSA